MYSCHQTANFLTKQSRTARIHKHLFLEQAKDKNQRGGESAIPDSPEIGCYNIRRHETINEQLSRCRGRNKEIPKKIFPTTIHADTHCTVAGRHWSTADG